MLLTLTVFIPVFWPQKVLEANDSTTELAQNNVPKTCLFKLGCHGNCKLKCIRQGDCKMFES